MSELTHRRLRQNPLVRSLVRETLVSHEQMLQPQFVVEGIRSRESVPGLTGVFRENQDSLARQVEEDIENGANKILLFGVPSDKKLHGFNSSFTAKSIEGLRKRFGKDLFIAVDVCLCSYTSHGQCGILNQEGDHVENSATVAELARSATEFAEAGADCVSPSDMMDGRIGAIRETLDRRGFHRTLVMSYSAKFHSKYYGPFRAAADSAPKGEIKLKDRATYQIDPANYEDALRSSLRDAEEGADIMMVKPGQPYLDVLYRLSQQINKPWAVYEVSGEYASVELMAREGLMNGPAAHVESWTGFKRAGADIIITYGARYAREWIKQAMEQSWT